MLWKFYLSFFCLGSVALGAPTTEPANSRRGGLSRPVRRSPVLDPKHIVVLNDDVETDHLIGSLSHTITSAIGFKYTKVLKGFSGTFGPLELTALRALPGVKYVTENTPVFATVVEKNSTYGLAITSQKQKLEKSEQNKYYYKKAKGPAYVYVIDTGTDVSDPEFEGRATFAKDFTGEGKFDGNGHGTHTAGTVGSKTYGVFKDAQIIAVKVLDSSGSGTTAAIIAGLDWVAKNYKSPAVINMSLGAGSVVKPFDDACRGATEAGVTVVVAAGNDGDYDVSSCDVSPSSERSTIAVGAINHNYKVAGFSNEGECTIIHGPGVHVLSTIPGNKTEFLSGTSMSSPHVAGTAAYLASQLGISHPDDVRAALLEYAQNDLLTNVRGASNVLVNNGYFE